MLVAADLELILTFASDPLGFFDHMLQDLLHRLQQLDFALNSFHNRFVVNLPPC